LRAFLKNKAQARVQTFSSFTLSADGNTGSSPGVALLLRGDTLLLIHTRELLSLLEEALPADQMLWVFGARKTKLLKMYLPLCACMEVLLSLGVC